MSYHVYARQPRPLELCHKDNAPVVRPHRERDRHSEHEHRATGRHRSTSPANTNGATSRYDHTCASSTAAKNSPMRSQGATRVPFEHARHVPPRDPFERRFEPIARRHLTAPYERLASEPKIGPARARLGHPAQLALGVLVETEALECEAAELDDVDADHIPRAIELGERVGGTFERE